MSDDRSTVAPEAPDVDLTAPVGAERPLLGVPPRNGPLAGPVPSVPGSAGYDREFGSLAPGRVRPGQTVRRYAAAARSPLPHLAAALAALLVAVAAVRWYLRSSPADGGPSGFQWDLLRGGLFGADAPSNAGAGGAAGWWAVAAALLAVVAIVAWLSRLGANARVGHGSFGPSLVLLALPSWWTYAVLVDTNGVGQDFDENRVRVVLLVLLLVGQALGVRWLFTHRLWNAGRLPHAEASFVLWVPNLVASFLVYGAIAFTYLTEEPGSGDDPTWFPTETTFQLAQWTSRATGAALALLALVVTVRQHRGIGRDRADHEVSTAELRAGTVPPAGADRARSLLGGRHARP